MNNQVFPTSLKSILFCLLLILACSCSNDTEKWVTSPDGKIKVDLTSSENGQLFYTVAYSGQPVMNGNQLGIIRKDADFSIGLKLLSVSESQPVSDQYKMLYGKQKDISYEAKKKVYRYENADGKKIDIIFQVSNDGVAFRYYFPEKSDTVLTITDEISSFQFNTKTLAWIQPIAKAKTGWNGCNPSYEENYFNSIPVDSLPVHEPGWVFPALFKTGDFWISLTETAPERDYCGSRLLLKKGESKFEIGFPDTLENYRNGAVNPESTLPWYTPWRIITLSDKLGTLIESTLGTDLAKPLSDQDFTFVKPGRSAWSWVLFKDDSTVYPVQKRFIDYASQMSWEYCLVDADWDRKIGYENLGNLVKYATSKNVSIIAWYNSAGDWNTTPYTPRDKMLTKESREAEFTKLNELGVKAVKVDFFGGDGQSMMSYYQDILDDAARHKIMVNFHGATYPRGLQRTYPNLVSMEAIKGFEFVTFEQSNADNEPRHCALIPFTRNLFDPMDFTPVCFSEVPNIIRKTSNSFELALSVIFLSGIQHFAEVPEGMAKVPEEVRKIMKEIPVSWDETKYIAGYPAEFVVIARRYGKTWYIAGINGKQEDMNLDLNLSFIENPGNATFITDGENNRTFKIEKKSVDFAQPISLNIKANGGFLYLVEFGK
jgi:hypothetical protein